MGQSLRKVNMNTYKLELGAITVIVPKLNFWDKILYTYPSFWLNLLGQHFYTQVCGSPDSAVSIRMHYLGQNYLLIELFLQVDSNNFSLRQILGAEISK